METILTLLTESPAFMSAMLPIDDVQSILSGLDREAMVDAFEIGYNEHEEERTEWIDDWTGGYCESKFTEMVDVRTDICIFKADLEDEGYFNYLNIEECRGLEVL